MISTELLQEKVNKALDLIECNDISDSQINELINEVKRAIKDHPDQSKILGPLIPQLNKKLQSRSLIPQLSWYPVGKGYLAIGHKPGGKISFEGMKMAKVDSVVTLLHENEGAAVIGHGLMKNEIEWLWLPFSASKPPLGDELKPVIELYERIKSALDKSKKIYLHCSAGIHRTGMVTYGLLRYLGYDKEQAFDALSQLRKITAEGATEERLRWADQFGN